MRKLEMSNGILICNPISEKYEMAKDLMAKDLVEAAIAAGLDEAARLGIEGREVTPFLLKYIVSTTGGQSLDANVQLLLDNAKVAAQIAVLSSTTQRTKPPATFSVSTIDKKVSMLDVPLSPPTSSVVCLGALTIDSTCTISSSLPTSQLLHTSHPGSHIQSLGGVAYNVAKAVRNAGYVDVCLISCTGDDSGGATITELLGDLKVHLPRRAKRTAQYHSINSSDGELILAVADMEAIETGLNREAISEIADWHPKVIVFDANILPDTMASLISVAGDAKRMDCFLSANAVIYEPTSGPKAGRIFDQAVNGSLPRIWACTPNALEIREMYNAASTNGFFDSKAWWQVIDSFDIGVDFRQGMQSKNAPNFRC